MSTSPFTMKLVILLCLCAIVSTLAEVDDSPADDNEAFGRAAAKPKPSVVRSNPAAGRPKGVQRKYHVQPIKRTFSTCNNTPRSKGQRIVGGEWAKPYFHKSIVLIKDSGSPTCGGTVVGPRWILTAAHCVYDKERPPQPNKYKVTAGEYVISKKEGPEQERDVVQIIMHQDYDFEADAYDIALLKLNAPIEYTDKIQQAILPHKNYLPEPYVTVAGWGALKDGAQSGSDILMQVDLPVIDDLECQRKYKDYVILPSMICTLKEGGGQDACQGDSGGPVYSGPEPILLGVVSWGEGCAKKNKPGVFSEVSKFRDWIEKTMYGGK